MWEKEIDRMREMGTERKCVSKVESQWDINSELEWHKDSEWEVKKEKKRMRDSKQERERVKVRKRERESQSK